jgi:3-oxoacyl-[acyl-carrier protein] reductase
MVLKGAVCIITGAATGIGSACARGLAAKGARVVIDYSRSEREAHEVAEACEALGTEAIVVRADVASDPDCRRLAQAALDRWGRIDGLINNAGTTKFVEHADLEALGAEDFQRIFGVNVVGAFQMTRAVVPAMQQRGEGAIVNISSVAGVMGNGSSIAYGASKGALNTMTLSLARALGPAIRVNAVCPGLVDTRWIKDTLGDGYEAAKASYERATPLGSVLTPDDVAGVAVWLLEGASKITGEVMLVDGGLHLGAPPLRAR